MTRLSATYRRRHARIALLRLALIGSLSLFSILSPQVLADDAASRQMQKILDDQAGTLRRANDSPDSPVVGVKLFILDDRVAELLSHAHPDLKDLIAQVWDLRPQGAAALKKLPRLETLQIGEVMLHQGQNTASLIGELTALRSLSLSGRHVTDELVQSLATLKGLRRLALPRTDVNGTALAVLKQMPALEELDLQYMKHVGDEATHHLRASPKLRILNLHLTSVSDDGVLDVGTLLSLEELTLPPGISDQGIVHLSNLTRLRKLDLGGRPDPANLAGGENLISFPRVRGRGGAGAPGPVIGLGGANQDELPPTPGLPDVHDRGLAVIGRFKELRELNVLGTFVGDEGMRSISGLTNLQILDLSETTVSDSALSQLGKLTQLQRLDLHETKIGATGLAALAGLKKLTSLNLRRTLASDSAMADLPKLQQLQHLDLSLTAVSNPGLTRLGGLKELQSLALSESKITGKGLESLRPLSKLRRLDLRKLNAVSDESLSALLGLKELAHLDLEDTDVSDAGIMRLAELPSLQYVSLRGPKLTRAGVDKLQSGRPHLRVHFREGSGFILDPLPNR